MKKRLYIASMTLVVFVLIIAFLLINSNSKTKLTYTCVLGDDPNWVDEILTINGIQYRNLKREDEGDLYDGKYLINNKEYKKAKVYALSKVDTPCDDFPIYSLKGLDPKKYVVKIAKDYTGYYDGSVYEAIEE